MVSYKILVKGSNFKLVDGPIGLANLVLVETADGPLLFDTGHYGNRRVLLRALDAAGYAPGDIGAVVLSHLHYDHSINVDLFPRAHLYLSRTEWEYGENPHPDDTSIPWKILDLMRDYEMTLVEEAQDITKGVHFFQVPGHTPGSSALALETERGTVVLAGDAVKYPKEILLQRPDLHYDTVEKGSESIRKIVEMADVIVPGHFGELCKCGSHFVWEEDSVLSLVSR
jgi:glyoxylase-like metal-dependent hydrolase (beta-lactamase superfamily II)